MHMLVELRKKVLASQLVEIEVDPIIGPVLNVTTKKCRAKISIYGGQVLSWQPVTQANDVLWHPRLELCQKDLPIRGGVPICWPWFGANKIHQDMPSHGYARISSWEINLIQTHNSDEIKIILDLKSVHERYDKQHQWLKIREIIDIGERLSIEIISENHGEEPVVITEGFHTYFNVSHIDRVTIEGLQENQYVDLLRESRMVKAGILKFNEELGRIYINTTAPCLIYDPGFQRKILIEKIGSKSTAVWNPWDKKSAGMSDLMEGDWQNFVCLESANALENAVIIAPMESHSMKVQYSVENKFN
jgi:D-hexose-6-phosphate mutarotase